VVEWRHEVEGKWGSLRFGDLRVETNAGHHVRCELSFMRTESAVAIPYGWK